MTESRYWMIERQRLGMAEWLRIVNDRLLPMSMRIQWTNTAYEAMQFHRRQDAEAFWMNNVQDCILPTITEHMDIGDTPCPSRLDDKAMVALVERLEADLSSVESYNAMRAAAAALTEQAATIARQAAQIQALERDAQRYRWLIDRPDRLKDIDREAYGFWTGSVVIEWSDLVTARIDAALDSAQRVARQDEGGKE